MVPEHPGDCVVSDQVERKLEPGGQRPPHERGGSLVDEVRSGQCLDGVLGPGFLVPGYVDGLPVVPDAFEDILNHDVPAGVGHQGEEIVVAGRQVRPHEEQARSSLGGAG